MPSPLWRHAPARAWRRGGSGLLLVAATVAATACAASVPMFAQLSGDSALSSTLAAVPTDARTADAAAVRLVGGRSPRSEDQAHYVDSLASIPGLTAPSITGRSVGPDVNYSDLFRPLVRANDVDARGRIVAVADPAAALVVTSGAPRPGAVWLSDPVAAQLHVSAGDTVSLLVQRHDATHPARKGDKPPVVATTTVAGTYAVAADGRRPADPAGTSVWTRRQGWLPTDSDLTTLPAELVVADVATADTLADRIGDPMLWSVESQLAPGLSLAEADAAARGVAELRRDVRAPDGTPQSGPLRLGLVSGIEVLVAQADSLASATAQRGELLARAGIVAGLLALLVIAVLMALDRRRELAHGASTGVGPFRTAGLWALETVLPAVVAVVIGVLLARLTLSVAGPEGGISVASVRDGALRASVVAGVGVVLVGVVGAIGVLAAERLAGDRGRRVPWVPVLVAVAVVAVVATLTTPASSAGPVALAVPALVAAALGAVLAVVAAWSFRRVVDRSSAGLPHSVAATSRWLALRRVARPGGDQPVVVAVAAVGLGMVLFALSAFAATRVVVADRVAVAAGARAVAQIDGSWVLDPDAPQLPTVDEVAAGKRIPEGVTPSVPDGMTLVWRTPVTVDGEFGYQDLLVADPAGLAAAASWGEGRTLSGARDALARLADAERAAMAAGDSSPVPVIAVGTTAFRTGDDLTMSGQEWSTPVRVVATLSTFPGASHDKGMLVAGSSTFFRAIPRWDPRLAPSTETLAPRPFFETWLWSDRPSPDVTTFLDSHGAQVATLSTADQATQQPALMAAERSLGYQVALAVFLALTALVAAAVHARRLARRSRAPDALLARVGLGRRGVAMARTWEVVLVVLVAFVAAVVANLLVAPLGSLLLDLDRGARPAYELHVTGWALLATFLVAMLMASTALLVGVRPMLSRGGPSPEEVVLRDG